MRTILILSISLFISLSQAFAVQGEERTGAYRESQDRAGLFIEPGLSTEVSSSRVTYPAPFSDSTGSMNGLGLTARLGMHFYDVLFFGADGRYLRTEFIDSANNMRSESTGYNLGPVLGIQTPFLGIRLAGTYIPWAAANPGETRGLKVDFSEGTGYRLGAGVRFFMLSVNLEYQHLTYGKTNVEKLGPFLPNSSLSSVQLTNDSYILGLSFPMSL